MVNACMYNCNDCMCWFVSYLYIYISYLPFLHYTYKVVLLVGSSNDSCSEITTRFERYSNDNDNNLKFYQLSHC